MLLISEAFLGYDLPFGSLKVEIGHDSQIRLVDVLTNRDHRWRWCHFIYDIIATIFEFIFQHLIFPQIVPIIF